MDLRGLPLQIAAEPNSSGWSGRLVRSKPDAMRPSLAQDCDIRLTLPARAENVALVRHVVGALAEALAMPPRLVEDIRLAVTEACTNVVRHAYREREGPLEISLLPKDGTLTVCVSDKGPGIVPNPASEGPGLGLPLIAALADSLEIDHGPSKGSRVTMSFRSSRVVEAG